MKGLVALFLLFALSSCMSSVVNSKKPLTENTPIKNGKFYTVETSDNYKISGRLKSTDAEYLTLIENKDAEHKILKKDISKIKKFSAWKSVFFPVAVIGSASAVILSIPGKENSLDY